MFVMISTTLTAVSALTAGRRRLRPVPAPWERSGMVRGEMHDHAARRAGDASARSALDDPLEDRARRALALCILVAGVPTIVPMWLAERSQDVVVAWGYPVLLATVLGYAWILLRRPWRAACVSRVLVTVAQVVWVGGVAFRLHTAQDVHAGWSALFPNSFMGIVVFLVVAFLYWPTLRATLHGLAVVVAAFAVGTTSLLALDGGGAYVRDMGRYCTYLAVVVALLHVLSRAKERLAAAVAEAARADATAGRLRDMVYLDELTGIGNRRRLVEEITHQAGRVGPSEPVAVVYFDLDHFKQINDTYGHAAGDRTLQVVARAAQRVVRESDVLARLGGEEFVVVAPGLDADSAVQLAERLRTVLRERVQAELGLDVTASFGVTQLRSGERPAAVLARVDALMYDAKREGRDRVVTASSGMSGRSGPHAGRDGG